MIVFKRNFTVGIDSTMNIVNIVNDRIILAAERVALKNMPVSQIVQVTEILTLTVLCFDQFFYDAFGLVGGNEP